MKIYVASSWRNEKQPAVVEALRQAGHSVYDYRHPEPGSNGFHWSAIDPEWKSWGTETFRDCLSHPIAENGFKLDRNALVEADATVLVLPCGRSAHLELGFATGMGQTTIVLLDADKPNEPELMYKLADHICITIEEVIEALRREQHEQDGDWQERMWIKWAR